LSVLPSSSEWCSLVLDCVLLTMKAPRSFEAPRTIFTTEYCKTPKTRATHLSSSTLLRELQIYQSVCSKAMACIWSYTPTRSGIFSDICVVRKIFLQAQLLFIFRCVRLAVQLSIFGVKHILGWNLRLDHELPYLKVFPVCPTTGSCTV
jgi:hypothetical protein